MLMRGFVLDRFDELLGRRSAIAAMVLQAGLFGLLHVYLGPRNMVVAATVGLVLGGVYLMSRRNLWPGVIAHGVLDSLTFTVLFLGLVPGAGH